MNDKIKVTTRKGLLAFLLHSLGFNLSEFTVFITFPGNKIGATMRADIPRQRCDLTARIVEVLRSNSEATATFMTMYTDALGNHPYAKTVKALEL